jgi:uncharacterized protein YlxW (UPF0749 family)
METKRDYVKEIHESIRIYIANRDLEEENEKLKEEIKQLNNEKDDKRKEDRERCNRISVLLDTMNDIIDRRIQKTI